MNKLLAGLAGVLLIATAVCVDPTRVVLGRLAGESFYAGRPTSYWGREVLRDSARVQESLKLPSPESLPVLREMLASKSDDVCFFACNAIAMIDPGAQSSVPDLIELLRHPNHYHRRNAAFALSTTIGPGDGEAVTPLISVIQEDDAWLNYFGSIALGKLGAHAKRAVPCLEGLRNGDQAHLDMLGKPTTDRDTIGYAARWAMNEITGQAHRDAETEPGVGAASR
jgi:hypothetical protein